MERRTEPNFNIINRQFIEINLQIDLHMEIHRVLENYRTIARNNAKVGEKRSILIAGDQEDSSVKKIIFISENETEPATVVNKSEEKTRANAKQRILENPSNEENKHICYVISNTGRVAFGPVEEVREIFKLNGHIYDSAIRDNKKDPPPGLPVLTKSLSALSVSKGNSASSNSVNSAGNKISKGRPPVGVGAGGRSAALSKMALLGEEWPEEEDLPSALPISSSLGAGNTLSKTVAKDVNVSKQRQGQRSSAKSKY